MKDVRAALRATRPLAVVNAAGFARVNQAELKPQQAFRDNVLGGEILASECRRLGIPILAFSSHLVFDGAKGSEGANPYVETDDPRALNVYGRTKIDMEARVLGAHSESLVIRAGSFISPGDPRDFIVRALRTLRARQPVYAADDALISPAYLPDLVNVCLDLLVDGLFGLVHLSSAGAASRAQLALSAAEFLRVDPELVRRPAGPVAARARRPSYSVLGSGRVRNLMPPLADALERNWRELTQQGLLAA
jgi:dTDP-4-dehydrorhamnose reductase